MNRQGLEGCGPGVCYPALRRNGAWSGGGGILQCLGSSARAAAAAEAPRTRDDELDDCAEEAEARPAKKGPQRELRLGSRLPERAGGGGGSLPASPDDEAPAYGPVRDASRGEALDRETCELICDFFAEYAGLCAAPRRRDGALRTVRRVVADVVQKHQLAYNGMIQKLSLDQQTGDMTVIRTVAQNIFSDGTTNWGRIASLVAFGAEVCRHLKETGREDCVKAVGHQISSYLLSEQRHWLINNKAWDGFVEFFHVEDTESLVRNALVAFASVAGIGAGLALLIR